ncbi:hypothetical protein, partial [Methanocalculus taiwanensis]|uniref:hypothetical protein n=1 Tax=Methanocalculus taiwanensis TaxID=106207 RepID=UPI002101102C
VSPFVPPQTLYKGKWRFLAKRGINLDRRTYIKGGSKGIGENKYDWHQFSAAIDTTELICEKTRLVVRWITFR